MHIQQSITSPADFHLETDPEQESISLWPLGQSEMHLMGHYWNLSLEEAEALSAKLFAAIAEVKSQRR